jgi:ketosteroid isomerase-like protein
MTYRSVATGCIFVMSLAGAASAEELVQATAVSARSETAAAEIASLITRYAQSVDGADTRLASEIWANAADVSFIHPLGHERGWEAVKANVYEKLMGETFSERKLDVKDVVVHAYPDTAWAEFYWEFVAKFRKDGTTLTTRGRESQVYRKTAGRWRLVHVHYSSMPVTGERQGF